MSKNEKKEVDLSPLKDFKKVWKANAVKKLNKPFDKSLIDPKLKEKAKSGPDLKMDGVEFINIGYNTKTTLGSMLSTDAIIPFKHPELGQFDSLTGFKYFVCVEPNSGFRKMTGSHCRKMVKSKDVKEVPGFKTIFAQATWYKVIQNDQLIIEMINSEKKPFKMYYERDGKTCTVTSQGWYLRVLEEIRHTLIKNNKLLSKHLETNPNVDECELFLPDFSFIK